jgi:hypothetical protein
MTVPQIHLACTSTIDSGNADMQLRSNIFLTVVNFTGTVSRD